MRPTFSISSNAERRLWACSVVEVAWMTEEFDTEFGKR